MKKLPIIIAVLVVIIIVGFLIFSKGMIGKGPIATPTPTPEETGNVEKIPESAIDVTIEPRYDKKAFTLIVKSLSGKGYKQFEYEVSYDAESSEDPTQTVIQGSASKEPILVSGNDFEREILLGTCSKNVCKYDKGVKSVNVVLRLLDNQGATKLWEKAFSME